MSTPAIPPSAPPTASQLVPTLPADATKFLNGVGAFSVPSGTGGAGNANIVYKNSDYVASANDVIYVDTSSNAVQITVPLTGIVEIIDAENSFGTHNCTIALPGGVGLLNGLTFSSATSVVLNAPGNNARCTGLTTSVAVSQAASGVWGQTTASAAASVAWTGLPYNVTYKITSQNVSTSAAPLSIQVGYGATTWVTGSYYWYYSVYQASTASGAATTSIPVGAAAGAWGANPADFTAEIDFCRQSSSYDALVKISCAVDRSNTVGVMGNYSSVTTPVNAIKVLPSSGTMSGILTLGWSKLNV